MAQPCPPTPSDVRGLDPERPTSALAVQTPAPERSAVIDIRTRRRVQ
jgi:hypothetical protein